MKKTLLTMLCIASAQSVAHAAGITDAQVADITRAAIALDQAAFRTAQLAKIGMVRPMPERSMLDVNAPGCSERGPDGKPLSVAGKQGDVIFLPRGATFSAECLIDVSK